MEILIPGLALVGFMVWLSTRIKRNAAKAFEREEIDTPEFSMVKPEGFLAPVDPVEGTLLSAYSKEFGAGEAERARKATIEVRRFDGAHLEEVRDRVVEESASVIEEQLGVLNQAKCANIVVACSVDDGVAAESHLKLIAAPNAVYQVGVTVLPEHKDEMSRSIDEALGSFSLKQ